MTAQGELIKQIKHFSLHPYAWPGGYPCFAITSDGAALCAHCTKREMGSIVTAIAQHLSDGWAVEAIEINWEDANLYCGHCGQRIEHAYTEN